MNLHQLKQQFLSKFKQDCAIQYSDKEIFEKAEYMFVKTPEEIIDWFFKEIKQQNIFQHETLFTVDPEERQAICEALSKEYHDRLVMSGSSGFNRLCDCCSTQATTTVCIEHDSMDFNLDKRICPTCYAMIMNIWKTKTPGKIPPFER